MLISIVALASAQDSLVVVLDSTSSTIAATNTLLDVSHQLGIPIDTTPTTAEVVDSVNIIITAAQNKMWGALALAILGLIGTVTYYFLHKKATKGVVAILLAFFAISAIQGCKTTATQTFIAQHCTEHHYVDLKTLEAGTKGRCDSLYLKAKVSDICPTAKVSFDAANASLEYDIKCSDTKSGYLAKLIKLGKKYIGLGK